MHTEELLTLLALSLVALSALATSTEQAFLHQGGRSLQTEVRLLAAAPFCMIFILEKPAGLLRFLFHVPSLLLGLGQESAELSALGRLMEAPWLHLEAGLAIPLYLF
jgi:hypothetical protein